MVSCIGRFFESLRQGREKAEQATCGEDEVVEMALFEGAIRYLKSCVDKIFKRWFYSNVHYSKLQLTFM